jgi:predicted nucleotidyltransferase
MKEVIIDKLKAIAAEQNITQLYACESGSRGWEFPSPDSDFDVRFIYVRPLPYYVSIAERSDNLSFPINDELDVYGWDIRKVLQLILKSNTTPFEWLQSPIVYAGNPQFREELWALCQHYFSQRSNIHHYLGIATGALESMQGEEIKIKKLFYVLRPLLSALWCLDKAAIAPMTIGPLMTQLPANLQQQVADLIDYKAGAAEAQPVKVDAALRTFIDEQMVRCREASVELPKEPFDREPLDTFFRKTIGA